MKLRSHRSRVLPKASMSVKASLSESMEQKAIMRASSIRCRTRPISRASGISAKRARSGSREEAEGSSGLSEGLGIPPHASHNRLYRL